MLLSFGVAVVNLLKLRSDTLWIALFMLHRRNQKINQTVLNKIKAMAEQHAIDVNAVSESSELVAEYEAFAEQHGLAVLICVSFGKITVWAQGKASHLCNSDNLSSEQIGLGVTHLVDGFYVNNTGE